MGHLMWKIIYLFSYIQTVLKKGECGGTKLGHRWSTILPHVGFKIYLNDVDIYCCLVLQYMYLLVSCINNIIHTVSVIYNLIQHLFSSDVSSVINLIINGFVK